MQAPPRPAVPRNKSVMLVGGGVAALLLAGVGYYLYTKKAKVAVSPVVTASGAPVGSTGSTIAALTPVTLAAAPTYSNATSTSVTHVQAYTTHEGQTMTGKDLTNAQQVDLPSCQTYCSAYPGCVGGTYGTINQNCNLKSSYDASSLTAAADTTAFVQS